MTDRPPAPPYGQPDGPPDPTPPYGGSSAYGAPAGARPYGQPDVPGTSGPPPTSGEPAPYGGPGPGGEPGTAAPCGTPGPPPAAGPGGEPGTASPYEDPGAPPPYGQQYGEPAGPAGHGDPGPPSYGSPGGTPGPYGKPGIAPPYGEAGVPPPYGSPGGTPAPYGDPGAPPPYGTRLPRPRLWPPTRAEWRVAAAAVAAPALVGLALAPLWAQLAPRLAFRVDQPGRALPVAPEAEEYVAADGRFVLLTLAAGVLAGLVCWFGRRSRGPLVLVALAAGGLLGAVLTWRLGLRLGTGYRPADLQVVGRTVYQPLLLRAKAALVVEPVAAVLVYLLGVGASARTDLGRGDEDPDGLSSGSG